MGLIQKLVSIGLIMFIPSCSDKKTHSFSADLNADSIPDFVKCISNPDSYSAYLVNLQLSKSDGSYHKDQPVLRFDSVAPSKLELKDFDSDGDLDILFTRHEFPYGLHFHNTYVMENKKGSFSYERFMLEIRRSGEAKLVQSIQEK